jgi:hypothetical protein
MLPNLKLTEARLLRPRSTVTAGLPTPEREMRIASEYFSTVGAGLGELVGVAVGGRGTRVADTYVL